MRMRSGTSGSVSWTRSSSVFQVMAATYQIPDIVW